jgi:histo-blood group ABO system transferase
MELFWFKRIPLGVCVLGLVTMVLVCSWMIHGRSAFLSQDTIMHPRYNIGLCIMATGKYADYTHKLIASARRYFCSQHNVTFFMFTDGIVPVGDDVVRVEQAQMGWPYDSMMRFHTYYKHKHLLQKMDYVFACDADMYFADEVGDEILSDLVGTVQPNFLFDPKPYERNPFSTACVNRGEEQNVYFAGAFYGGRVEPFLALVKAASESVDIDLARGYIACCNDESHLNRYFIDHQPHILSPSYCYFEGWRSPYYPRIIAIVDKNYGMIRAQPRLNPLNYYVKMLQDRLSYVNELTSPLVVSDFA